MELPFESLKGIVGELRTGNDRACAVVAGSLLEFQLERLLTAHLIGCKESQSLFGSHQPLSTFSSRIALSHALGLIPNDVFQDLNRIRKIRNEFSHQFATATFDTEPVKSHCQNLLATTWLLKHHHMADVPIGSEEVEDIASRPRRSFELSVALASIAIDILIMGTKQCEQRRDFYAQLRP